MKVTQEIWEGIAGLIEMVANDAVKLEREGTYTAHLGKGMAQSVAAQICQHLEAEEA